MNPPRSIPRPLLLRASLVFALLASLILPAAAEDRGNREAEFLRAYFAGEVKNHGAAFTPGMLKVAPPAKLDEIRDLYKGKLGELRETPGRDGAYELIFTRGKAPCRIQIDADGKVASFWLGQWSMANDDPITLAAEFAKLVGSVSVTVWRDDTEQLFSIAPDSPMAVGSSFKLYVLKALEKAAAEGRLTPETVVRLNPEWKTLPSGISQEWPASSPITLATLANLMISISDNTATDHLIAILGRENVEAVAPERMRPFLMTMEMFRLKYAADTARAEAFAKADTVQRRDILTRLGTASFEISDIRKTPFLIDSIEWFVTTNELCHMIFELRDNPSVGINPGLVDKRQWHRVAFKGGSEPGVLNYTIALQKAPASPTFTLSATINDTAHEVNTDGFTELVLRLITLIEDGRLYPRKE